MNDKQVCLECGKPLYGRTDKKFCSSACKNDWHYQQSAGLRSLKSWTATALARNHRILRGLLGHPGRRFKLVELQLCGFTPQLVTGHLGTEDGISRYTCYDIHYSQTDAEIFDVRPANLYKK